MSTTGLGDFDRTLQTTHIWLTELMGDDAGAVPVGENNQLVGMITDRDLAVRVLAEGRGPETSVREVMTADVLYGFEDDGLDTVGRNMADQQVRRLAVVNRDKRLVSILSLGDMAVMQGSQTAATALGGISEPGGQHSRGKERLGGDSS